MSITVAQRKKKVLNHLAYLRKRGVVLTKEQFLPVARKYFSGAVLTSRDGSWKLESLCWKEKDWFVKLRFKDGLHLYRSGKFWYSKKHEGSWRSREEATAKLLGGLDTPGREQSVAQPVKDWSEDTAFNQNPSYDGF